MNTRTQASASADDLSGTGEDSPETLPFDPSSDAGDEAPDPDVARHVTLEASRKGWMPKDKFKGDPDTWVDAQTFLDRGEKINKNLIREVKELRAQIASFEGTREQFKKFHEETIARKDQELDAAIRQLRVQRAEAIREGEDEAAINLEDRIDTLREEQKSLKKQAPAADDTASAQARSEAIMESWIADGNDWFKSDPKLRAYALSMGEELLASGETLRDREFLDKISGLMREEFPAKFRATNPNRHRPSGAESQRQATSTSVAGNRSKADLPAADRALMEEFVKSGWTTEEAFLKSYWSR